MNKHMKKKNKNPPYFSHQFVIQNHADIVSFIAMFLVLGLMFKFSTPFASLFITLQHNVTLNDTDRNQDLFMYTNGRYDFCPIFFYFLICIVLHAMVQEYICDKLNKKFNLSRTKFSKFNESGQFVAFYVTSLIWMANLVYSEGYITSMYDLWEGYPHSAMSFWTKIFFMSQIAYWLHNYPELYFQKVKREEMMPRIIYSTLYLIAAVGMYVLNLTRLGFVLLFAHFFVELMFHVSRLLYFMGRSRAASVGFILWQILYVAARIFALTATYVTLYIGLDKTSKEIVDLSEGNFNTRLIRLNIMVFVAMVQAYMMWNFITFHQRRINARAVDEKKQMKVSYVTNVDISRNKRDEDFQHLTEADQNQVKETRQRRTKAK